MRGPAFCVALVAVLAAAAPAAAQDDPGAALAAALERNPVYADPAARPTLTPAQAERLRLRIVEMAPGRISIAVVPVAQARRLGGVRGVSSAIDRHLDIHGSLLVLAGGSAWVTVSYPAADRAVAAVRRAFAGNRPFATQLTTAVDNLARADPGPDGDGPGPAQNPDFAADVERTVKIVFLIVGALIALPFLVIGFLIFRAVWRAVGGARSRSRGEHPMAPPPTAPSTTAPSQPVDTDRDAQRAEAEKAFGGE